MQAFVLGDHIQLKWKQAGHWCHFTRQCVWVRAGGIMFHSTCHLLSATFCNAAPHRDVYATGCNTYVIFWYTCAVVSDSSKQT